MIERVRKSRIDGLLTQFPAVALLGPRQSGKTTLALEVGKERASIYLDLESPRDTAKLSEPEMFLSYNEDKLVILDEIQRVPALFPTLRGLIDRGRRKGLNAGRFLLLGSASVDLLKQASETLAGRIARVELTPFAADEISGVENALDRLWVRGGFPDSFLAPDDSASFVWRAQFINTYLEKDIPQFGPRVPSETLRRFWTMLAHNQGTNLNASQLAAGIGVSSPTISRYLDLMVDLFLVRRVEPWTRNTKKRLTRAPKVYVRDSGIVHTLLDIPDMNALLGHPVVGASWEGFVVENLISVCDERTRYGFYRTQAGAEIDFVIQTKKGLWAIEIKRSLSPTLARGFWTSCEDLNPSKMFVVYPGNERFPLKGGVEAISLPNLMSELRNAF